MNSHANIKKIIISNINFRRFHDPEKGELTLISRSVCDKSVRNKILNDLEEKDIQAMFYYLERNPKITSLTIKGFVKSRIFQLIAKNLVTNTTLTFLDLSHNKLTDKEIESIADCLVKNKTISSLNLSGNKICIKGAEALGKCLKGNTTLTSLDLHNCEIGDQGIIALELKNNQNLKFLNIGDNNIKVAGALSIANYLKYNPSLISFDISKNKIGDEGIITLTKSLGDNISLASLNISRIGIGKSGFLAITDYLENNKTLKSLNISKNLILKTNNNNNDNISDRCFTALAASIELNTTLTSLNLSKINKISLDNIHRLAYCLSINKTITSLDLSNNNLDASAIKNLLGNRSYPQADSILSPVSLDSLTSLNISHNKLGDEGAEELANWLATNSTLTSLDISKNEISVNGAIVIANCLMFNKTLASLNINNNTIQDKGLMTLAAYIPIHGMLTSLAVRENKILKEGMSVIIALQMLSSLKIDWNESHHDIYFEPDYSSNKSKFSELEWLALRSRNEIEHLKKHDPLIRRLEINPIKVRENLIEAYGKDAIQKYGGGITKLTTGYDYCAFPSLKDLCIFTLKKHNQHLKESDLEQIPDELHKKLPPPFYTCNINFPSFINPNNLGELIIDFDKISWIGELHMESLFDYLNKNPKITSVSLIGCVTENVKNIANLLAINTTVTSLDLRNGSFGDEGGIMIAGALAKNRTLKSLNLRGTCITEKTVKALANVLKTTNNTLTHLDIRDIGINSCFGLSDIKTLTLLSDVTMADEQWYLNRKQHKF